MKFDARSEKSPEKKDAFVAWLTTATVSTLQTAGGDPEKLKAAAFLFANRAREAGLAEQDVAEIIGVGVARAGLSPADEDALLEFVETFDPIAMAVHASPKIQKRWWRFWS
jgi:hypothetical protein